MKYTETNYKKLESKIKELEQENHKLKQRIEKLHSDEMNLNEEPDIYFLFLNSLKDFFWILDEQGQIKFANDYAVNRLGYSHEEFYQMNVLNVHPPERREEAMKIVGEMISGVAEFCPIPIMTKTDEYIPVETRIVKGIWNNENVIFGISKDISELRLSEEKFSKAFHINSNLSAISDYDTGNFIDVNTAFLQTFGFTKDEVIGKNSVELKLFNQKTRLEIQKNIGKNNEFRNIEIAIQNKDKTVIGLFSGAVFFLQGTKCWITTMQDITKIKNTEKALAASEARWKFALEGAGDGLWDWDLKQDLVFLSRQWKAMLGFEENEIGNHLDEWSKRVHPDDLSKCYEDINKHLNGENDMYSNTHRVLCKNGNYKWILDRGKVVDFSDEGKPLRMIGTHHDLTERIKIEHELKKLNADKDRFMQIISHDLRSPFNAILGFSHILKIKFDKYDTKTQKKYIDIIHQSANNSYKLLENLLLWSRSQKGSIDFNPESINLFLLATETSVFFKQSAEKKSIKLLNKIPENIFISADKNMLSTIIRNLISNAIKFTHVNGKITISAKLITDDNNRKFVETGVKDTGLGISKEMQSKLFDISENISTEGTENEKGTGLGLLLCKEFLEKHEGGIRVQSELGKGTEFKFTIPLLNKTEQITN